MSAVAADEAHRVVQIASPRSRPTRSTTPAGPSRNPENPNGTNCSTVCAPTVSDYRCLSYPANPSSPPDHPQPNRSPRRTLVLVYGHRRRAAALEAGRDTVPAVVDDAIMADDGDLDAMATENLGRQDLSDLAEANLFARYSEIGLSQRAIAERLGIDQATVSRRLALLLLSPNCASAVEDGTLRSADAATLSGALPYGPPRRWQKTKDPLQDSEQRGTEQAQALQLILSRGMWRPAPLNGSSPNATPATKAAELGIPLVEDPRAELGDSATNSESQPTRAAPTSSGRSTPARDRWTSMPAPVAAAPAEIDTPAGSGAADVVSPRRRPHADHEPRTPRRASAGTRRRASTGDGAAGRRPASKQHKETSEAADAQKQRRQSCAVLINQQPSNAELLKVLVGQYLSGVAARSATSGGQRAAARLGRRGGRHGGEGPKQPRLAPRRGRRRTAHRRAERQSLGRRRRRPPRTAHQPGRLPADHAGNATNSTAATA